MPYKSFTNADYIKWYEKNNKVMRLITKLEMEPAIWFEALPRETLNPAAGAILEEIN